MAGLVAVFGGIAALFAGAWARQKYRVLKEDRDRIQATRDAIDRAAERLAAARKASTQATPIDARRRTDFEKQP